MTTRPLLAGVVITAGVAIAGFGASSPGGTSGGEEIAVARRGSLAVTISESGVLRAGASVTYRSPLEGREVEVIWLAPEGSVVDAGEVLARLDASALVLDLERARQTVRQVEMQMAGARLQREEAVMSMQSVTGGAGTLLLEESRTELRLLEARAARMQAAHEQLRPLFAKGYITRDELDRSAADAEEAAARADLAARANRVLAEQTQPASEQAARLQVARRESDLLNLQPQLESARAYVKTLEELVARCTIRAVNPGLIVYDENLAVTPKRKVRPGDRVTPSQGIVTLPDLAVMAIDASVRESDVMMLAPGARVRARLDALPDVILTGKVARIGAIAQASRPDLSESRFAIGIDLDRAAVPLRPSMNARIDIETARPESVLVPVTAVRLAAGRHSCLVETGGRWQTRFVTLGRSNSTDTEIIDGIAAGERVRLKPAEEQ